MYIFVYKRVYTYALTDEFLHLWIFCFQFISMSAKRNLNIEMPFLWLSQRLLKPGWGGIRFVEKPAELPPQVHLTQEQIDRMEAELEVRI